MVLLLETGWRRRRRRRRTLRLYLFDTYLTRPSSCPNGTYYMPTSTLHMLSSYLSVSPEESGRSMKRRHVSFYIFVVSYRLLINTSSLYTPPPPPPPPHICVKSQAGTFATRHPPVEINLGESPLV